MPPTTDGGVMVRYGQAKLAQVMHAAELHRRESALGSGVTAYSLHPGVINTNVRPLEWPQTVSTDMRPPGHPQIWKNVHVNDHCGCLLVCCLTRLLFPCLAVCGACCGPCCGHRARPKSLEEGAATQTQAPSPPQPSRRCLLSISDLLWRTFWAAQAVRGRAWRGSGQRAVL